MKAIFYLFIVLFMSINFSSCTPTSIVDESVPQATGECCDEEGTIPPPPPPPPPGG